MRQCTKDYTIKAKTKNENDLKLAVGDLVVINSVALHRDPDHFPDPMKFDPERFNQESNDIKKYPFLPFSTGPRNCIGLYTAAVKLKYKI